MPQRNKGMILFFLRQKGASFHLHKIFLYPSRQNLLLNVPQTTLVFPAEDVQGFLPYLPLIMSQKSLWALSIHVKNTAYPVKCLRCFMLNDLLAQMKGKISTKKRLSLQYSYVSFFLRVPIYSKNCTCCLLPTVLTSDALQRVSNTLSQKKINNVKLNKVDSNPCSLSDKRLYNFNNSCKLHHSQNYSLLISFINTKTNTEKPY